MTYAPSEDSVQPGHPPSLITESSLSAWRQLESLAILWAQAKTLIRLGGCPGWSESSRGAHAILLVLSCAGSYNFSKSWNGLNIHKEPELWCLMAPTRPQHSCSEIHFSFFFFFCFNFAISFTRKSNVLCKECWPWSDAAFFRHLIWVLIVCHCPQFVMLGMWIKQFIKQFNKMSCDLVTYTLQQVKICH